MNRIKLEGKSFGSLIVDSYIGNGKYNCLCKCGKRVIVDGGNLRNGHVWSCGCGNVNDLSGKIYGALRVIKRADSKKRGNQKRVVWECVCECGNNCNVYADALVSGITKSCGCLLKNRGIPAELKEEYIDGTQVTKIKSIPTKSNKSGVVGVNWDKSRDKWQASIRFKGHKYNLGRFDEFELACKARKEAEKNIFGSFLESIK